MGKTYCARQTSWILNMMEVSKQPVICLHCDLRLNCKKYLQGDLILKERYPNIQK